MFMIACGIVILGTLFVLVLAATANKDDLWKELLDTSQDVVEGQLDYSSCKEDESVNS